MSAWLGAGALSVGIGAAVFGGTAAAYADSGNSSGGARHGTRPASSAAPSVPTSTLHSSRPAAAGRSATARRAAGPDATHADTTAGIWLSVKPQRAAAASSISTRPAAKQVSRSQAAPTGKTVGSKPGPIVSLFISDGTLSHPDAGLLIGNGFSFTAVSCAANEQCNGGNGGLLYGNGGNGGNGGAGGQAGMVGNGGNGGPGSKLFGGTGGNGGSAGLFGSGGNGGDAERSLPGGRGGDGGSAGLVFGNGGNGGGGAAYAIGGRGGDGGLFFGVGGRGGPGGPGIVDCREPTCSVSVLGGVGGRGGSGGLLFGRGGGDGAGALPLNAPQFTGYTPVYPANGEVNANGTAVSYPNPYYIPGTVVADVQLPAGLALSRWGFQGGGFLAPDGTSFAQLALPPFSQVVPYFEYIVNDPASLPPGYQIELSQVASYFGQPGGGVQYRIIDPFGKDGTVQALLDSGYLRYR